MYFQQIISYGNAWNRLVEHFPSELNDIRQIVAALTPENIAAAQPLRDLSHYQEPGVTRYRLDGCWAVSVSEHGWNESNSAVINPIGRPINMRGLGYIKNGVSVSLLRHRESINRWLYTIAPIATRNGHIDIPVAVVLLQPAEEALFGHRPMGMSPALERAKEELIALSPLSHANPFLLIGIGLEDFDADITEIESEGEGIVHQIVINRSIEFSPEYHQAGLGILSYFGTVLREKYPESNAKVKIEQDGLLVRLIIESDNGDKEIIEKALQEYELVVCGEKSPESFFDSKTKVLELKSELRIAQVRIEGQRDLIEYQGEEIASLRQIIGHSLTTTKMQPISITVNPAITVNTSTAVQIQQVVPALSECVQNLASQAATYPDVELRLLDLDDSLNAIATKQTPEAVKESSGVRKLKRFLDDAAETGSSVNAFLSKVNDGVGLVQKLARRYNELADWCGAPQVPTILLGKDA